MEIFNYTDDELTELMNKYKEKDKRYKLLFNEATERNEKIILHIHKEMVRRFVNKNLDKMNINE